MCNYLSSDLWLYQEERQRYQKTLGPSRRIWMFADALDLRDTRALPTIPRRQYLYTIYSSSDYSSDCQTIFFRLHPCVSEFRNHCCEYFVHDTRFAATPFEIVLDLVSVRGKNSDSLERSHIPSAQSHLSW